MTSVIDRLMAKVEERDGCWVFTGAKTAAGYGALGAGSRGAGTVYAHRVSYEHHVGVIPDGKQLDHLCRNRACCNPAHLEPVTQRVNILRGAGGSAENARKTHCKRGHEFTPENTRLYGRGRHCRACEPIRRQSKENAA